MLSGLKHGQAKMSKSDPNSAIFMEDTVEEVNEKIKQAYCKEKEVYNPKDGSFINPIMDYSKSIVLPALGKIDIVRPEKYGGNM